MRNEIYSKEHRKLREILKRERKSARLRQSDIAKQTNRSQAYISKFENGDLRLDVVDFMKICTVIGCDPFAVLKEMFHPPTDGATSIIVSPDTSLVKVFSVTRKEK